MSMITKANAEALMDADVVSEIMQGAVTQSKALQVMKRLRDMTSDQMKLKVLDALPVAYWVNEEVNNGRKSLSKASWDNVFIKAKELAVIIPIKQNTLDDANIDIWEEIKPRLAEAFGRTIDEAVLVGVNNPFDFNIVDVVNEKGNVVTPEADETLYSQINRAMGMVEEDGFIPNAILGGLESKAKFRMMLDTTGQPIANTEIGELQKYYVDNGAWDKSKATLIVGDFTQGVYSIRQDMTYKVLEEAIIQDPSTGAILYNLAQDDMVALRVTMRLGFAVPNPVTSANDDEDTRYPFAVIKPAT